MKIKEFIKNKKLFKLTVIVPTLILIFLAPKMTYVYNSKKGDFLKVKNKYYKTYLINNKNNLSNSCFGEVSNINYYNSVYSQIINIIFSMGKNNYFSEKDRNTLFSFIKRSEVKNLLTKIKNVNLLEMNTDSMAEYDFLIALINDLNFSSRKTIEEYYRKAIDINKFNSNYYLQLSKFYTKNCNYDKAINTLLDTLSLMAMKNDDNKNNLYNIYYNLGDLYFSKRDYENSMVYYTNALVNLDYRNKNLRKAKVLIKLGDIMTIRGEYFEAINYYKYALSLNDKKLQKDERILLLLKLSNTYYSYGNYENSLKFAKNAVVKAKKLNDTLLYSKAKYYICLNYEYLGKSTEKIKENCDEAIKKAEEYKEITNNVYSYINLAEMLDYSAYTRDPVLAINYLNTALSLNYEDNVYTKINILEKIASIKTYTGNNKLEVFKIYNDLDGYYNKYNIDAGCCNDILKGFAKELTNIGNPEIDYLHGEIVLKNKKTQLITLYSYISDFYRNRGQGNLALHYAIKGLKLSKQIYKFDHHYIKYMQDKLDILNK